MMCVANNFAVLCADAIDDEKEKTAVLKSLEESGKEIILITEKQVKAFAGNMLEVCPKGSDESILVMSQSAFNSLTDQQRSMLEKHATLLASPLDTIETLGGGSARCMMAEVFLPSN
jgi:hypothetical protein